MTDTRILLVEDDDNLRFGIRFNLQKEGWQVFEANSVEAAEDLFSATEFDFILLDVMLPGKSGLEWLEELRGSGRDLPIVMLTARSDESDAVTALTLGADDYIRKPFGLSELIARIAAILRRARAKNAAAATKGPLEVGSWTIDPRDHSACGGGDGAKLALTNLEVEILDVLNASRGEAVSREDLLATIWGIDSGTPTRTLDNHVARLRKKLEEDPQNPEFLVTVYGVGYRLNR